ncbi:MAG: RNA pseudouridine synthase [bacterium]
MLSSFQVDETLLEKAIWHGGFYLNKQRLTEQTFPLHFEKGSEIDFYCFLREPEPIVVDSSMILREEEGWMAVNKPPGLPVQGSRVSIRFSLQEALRNMTGCKGLSAVHRLDRETSGILLFAKEKRAEAALMKQFHDQKAKKIYRAVVTSAESLPESGKVEGYLIRDFRRLPQNFYRLKPENNGKGKWSESEFECLKREGELALSQIRPKTGRTHQIRVHLASLGCPILGDDLYGKKSPLLKRMQLHAFQLELNAPVGKASQSVQLTAPVPEDFVLNIP